MDDIIKALGGVLPMISQHWMATIAVMVLLAGLAVYLVVSKNFTWFAENLFKPRTQQQHFTNTLNAGARIQSALARTLGYTNADRICLFEFHNGNENLGGVPFLHARLTYIDCGPGISVTDDLHGSLPLSYFSDFTEVMWNDPKNPHAMSLDARDVKHPLMKSLHVRNGCEFNFAVPVTDIYGNAIGMVIIGYNDRDTERPGDLEIGHKMNNLSMEICGLLRLVKGKPKMFFNR